MNVSLIDLLYELKRDWGQPIQYISVTTSEADPVTGQVGTGSHVHPIAQVIIFPSQVARDSMGGLRAGSYPYDSNYDKGSHVGLIEKTDFPLALPPTRADTIITNDDKRYEVKEINDLYEAWELILVELVIDD